MSKIHYSIDGDKVVVEVYTGERYSEKDETVSVTEFDLSECPAELKDGEGVKTFASYGLLKWLQDRTSGVKGAVDKVEAMVEEFNSKAMEGLWKAPAKERAPRAAGSRRKISATLAAAVAELTGQSAITAEASLKALSKEQFESLCAKPQVTELVAKLEAEAEAPADLSALLDSDAA